MKMTTTTLMLMMMQDDDDSDNDYDAAATATATTAAAADNDVSHHLANSDNSNTHQPFMTDQRLGGGNNCNLVTNIFANLCARIAENQ